VQVLCKQLVLYSARLSSSSSSSSSGGGGVADLQVADKPVEQVQQPPLACSKAVLHMSTDGSWSTEATGHICK
jgi:hypothetical protein